jgi:predicted ATP-dependent endonuclease of OLD family
MKLINLKLSNFKGIRKFEFRTDGKDVSIMGDNASGKTTLADAFMWLLFDKDSANRKDFEIKTLGPDGEPEHGLEHTVEAILELEDGSQLALKKVFKEKWTKKRGSATAEFTGHTTDYCLDGVPVKKKEYDEKITEIADENIFRLLTDPRYFNEILHWQKRRELLLEVCGDVSDAEVIASKTDLSKLSEILGNRTIEQHRKVIQARRSEINKELERIPVRIDEVNLGLPRIDDITDPDALPSDIASDIEKLRNELRNKQEELAQAKAGGQVAELVDTSLAGLGPER